MRRLHLVEVPVRQIERSFYLFSLFASAFGVCTGRHSELVQRASRCVRMGGHEVPSVFAGQQPF